MRLMTVASLLLLAALSPFVIGKSVQAQSDQPAEKRQAIKMPDISGKWMSDSPLESFVADNSSQPVNRFDIEKLDDGAFQARYIGQFAVGVKLKWVEEKQYFTGTIKEGEEDKTTFVVIPTQDAEVLTCKIYGESLVSKERSFHFDKWKRHPLKLASATPKTESGKGGTSQGESTVVLYDGGVELTAEKQADTEKTLVAHFNYLKSLGFKLERGQATLRLQTGMGNAHYYHNNRSIVMDPLVLSDISILEREYNHHALAVALGEDSKEIFETCSGIESALADYLGCSHSNDPEVGIILVREIYGPRQDQHYLRTLDNLKSFTELNAGAGRHQVGEVLGGALWEIRGTITMERLDPMLYKAWIGIVKTDTGSDQVDRFVASLLNVANQENAADAKKMRTIFERRGLQLP
jgi:hypothetical protein